jgi:hypothetical protein
LLPLMGVARAAFAARLVPGTAAASCGKPKRQQAAALLSVAPFDNYGFVSLGGGVGGGVGGAGCGSGSGCGSGCGSGSGSSSGGSCVVVVGVVFVGGMGCGAGSFVFGG